MIVTASLRARLKRLERIMADDRPAKAITDAARLDWLERRNPRMTGLCGGSWLLSFRGRSNEYRDAEGPTLRDAIDAGMRSTGDA